MVGTETDLHFGTAGWSYPDWEGTVYPLPRPSHFNPLAFLARDFDFVEVNTTFYRIPSPRLTQGWVQKTSDHHHFQFWLKLFQGFTHKRHYSTTDVDRFLDICTPLADAGKLAGLLAQFPYSFKPVPDNLRYLEDLHASFRDRLLAVEFRHRGWNHPHVLSFFRERNLVWVNIDQPVISQSLPPTAHLTHATTSYVRLHGRNYASWFAGTGRDARYDYDYGAEELTEIAGQVKKLSRIAKTIFISGNNHYQGQAIKNLKELKQILAAEPSNATSPAGTTG